MTTLHDTIATFSENTSRYVSRQEALLSDRPLPYRLYDDEPATSHEEEEKPKIIVTYADLVRDFKAIQEALRYEVSVPEDKLLAQDALAAIRRVRQGDRQQDKAVTGTVPKIPKLYRA